MDNKNILTELFNKWQKLLSKRAIKTRPFGLNSFEYQIPGHAHLTHIAGVDAAAGNQSYLFINNNCYFLSKTTADGFVKAFYKEKNRRLEQSLQRMKAFGRVIDLSKEMLDYHEIKLFMSLGQAMEAMKLGKRVCRKAWIMFSYNDYKQTNYLYYVPANEYPAVTEIAKGEFGDKVPYAAYIALKGINNTVIPWIPNNDDLLAEDYYIFNDGGLAEKEDVLFNKA